jgi:lysophospholipase L1-like esterase
LPAAVIGALALRDVRSILAAAVEQRRRSDPNLLYLDGLSLFGTDDLEHLPDGLHPDTEGYARMGNRFIERAEVERWLTMSEKDGAR